MARGHRGTDVPGAGAWKLRRVLASSRVVVAEHYLKGLESWRSTLRLSQPPTAKLIKTQSRFPAGVTASDSFRHCLRANSVTAAPKIELVHANPLAISLSEARRFMIHGRCSWAFTSKHCALCLPLGNLTRKYCASPLPFAFGRIPSLPHPKYLGVKACKNF